MRHTLIVPPLTALSLIAAAISFSPRASGTVNASSPRLTQAAAQSASPAATAAAFEVVTELDKAIWHIFQDSKGTYWFGSPGQGLYRRDGNTFAHFTTDSGLSDNYIGVGKILEDKLGNLYIATANGISKFDGRTFTTLKVDDADPSSTEWKLEPDDLWFPGGQDTGVVYRYDGKSLRKLTFPTTADGDVRSPPRSKYPNAKYSPYDVYTVFKDSRGNVWFGTSNLGACRYDGKTFAWISETELGFDEKDNRNFGTRSLIEDRDGKFWITVTRHRFDMYPPKTGSATQSAGGLPYIKSAGLAHAKDGVDEDYTYIMSMAEDKAGDLWMATSRAGVWRYNGKTLTNYPVLVDGKPITVFSIYRDREDGLWLGTHEHGVCKFNGKAFEKVTF